LGKCSYLIFSVSVHVAQSRRNSRQKLSRRHGYNWPTTLTFCLFIASSTKWLVYNSLPHTDRSITRYPAIQRRLHKSLHIRLGDVMEPGANLRYLVNPQMRHRRFITLATDWSRSSLSRHVVWKCMTIAWTGFWLWPREIRSNCVTSRFQLVQYRLMSRHRVNFTENIEFCMFCFLTLDWYAKYGVVIPSNQFGNFVTKHCLYSSTIQWLFWKDGRHHAWENLELISLFNRFFWNQSN
jgi:hypothetical protein